MFSLHILILPKLRESLLFFLALVYFYPRVFICVACTFSVGDNTNCHKEKGQEVFFHVTL